MALYKRGNRWRVEIRRQGVYRSRTFRRKANAEQWEARVLVALEGGETPEAAYTVRETIERYLSEVTPHKKGAHWETVRLKRFLRHGLCNKRLKDVTPEDMAAWRDERLKQVKPASVRRELNIWSAIFSVARREWKWINENPVSDIRKPPGSPHRTRVISDSEIEDICRFAASDVKALFLLALETGMRLGEMISIDPQDIRGNYVILRDTKNSQPREVPLTRKAREILAEWAPFTTTSESASRRFANTVQSLKIEDLTFHDARHTAATRLAGKLSVLELCKMFGWRDPKNAMIYFNPTASDLAGRLDTADTRPSKNDSDREPA